jgi:hypothetical protein
MSRTTLSKHLQQTDGFCRIVRKKVSPMIFHSVLCSILEPLDILEAKQQPITTTVMKLDRLNEQAHSTSFHLASSCAIRTKSLPP